MRVQPTNNKDRDDDRRPVIKDLLNESSAQIEQVRNSIKDHALYDSELYDNIWILRFVLSHKNSVKKATEAALNTMEFRNEKKLNELGDIRHRIYNHQDRNNPNNFDVHKRYFSHMKENAIIYQLPDPNHGVLVYIRLADCDLKTMGKQFSVEEVSEGYLLLNEATFQIQDEISRRTGKLTKLFKVIDLNGMKLANFDLSYVKLDSAATKSLENYYPQLTAKILVVNPPSWFNYIWNIVKPLLPIRVTEKISVASSKKKILRNLDGFVSADKLHKSLGGTDKIWPPQHAGHLFRTKQSPVQCQ